MRVITMSNTPVFELIPAPEQFLLPELPIHKHAPEIEESLRTNTVTVIQSPTGSGKTTQVPQIAFRSGEFDQVIVTQPRIIAARELCARVAEETEGLCDVGYYTSREGSEKNQDDNDIVFLTDGKAAKQMASGRYESDKKILLVIDEVHEWNPHTELLLALAKQQTDPTSIHYNPNLKVVIMSATFNGGNMQDYFSHAKTGFIEVEGKNHHVQEIYKNCSATEAIVDEVEENPYSKILTFLPGVPDIKATKKELEDLGVTKQIVILHGKLSKEKQQLVTKDYPEGVIILATNIAETSLTISGVNCVIDTGMQRIDNINYYIDPNGVDELLLRPAPVSSVAQRGGRTGRDCPGKHIYVSPDGGITPPMTINERRKYQEFQTPAILRSRLDDLVLSLAVSNSDIDEIPFYHKPNPKAVVAAKRRLFNFGAIDALGKPTPRGKIMSRLPLDTEFACMLAVAKENKIGDRALSSLITMVTIMQLGGIFDHSPKRQAWKKLLQRDDEHDPSEKDSDYFAQLEGYVKLTTSIPRSQWSEYHINENAMSVVERDREVIADRLNMRKRYEVSRVDPLDRARLLEIINVGGINQIWQKKGLEWQNIFTGQSVEQTPSSVVTATAGKLATGSFFMLEGIGKEGVDYAISSIQEMTRINNIAKLAKNLGHLVMVELLPGTLTYNVKNHKWEIQGVRMLGTVALEGVETLDAETINNPPGNKELSRVYKKAMFEKLKEREKHKKPISTIDEANQVLEGLRAIAESNIEECKPGEVPKKMALGKSVKYGHDPITDEPLYAFPTANGGWTQSLDSAIRSFEAKIKYIAKKPLVIEAREAKKEAKENAPPRVPKPPSAPKTTRTRKPLEANHKN